jgi:hypothetical protein
MRRRVGWAIALMVLLATSRISAMRLAAQDPISEVLMGRSGTTLPLCGIVLLFRFTEIVILPVVLAMVLVSTWPSRRPP